MSDDLPIRIRTTRTVAASPNEVFDAWLDPLRAARFLFATPGGRMTRVEIDPREGGRFCIVERRETGEAEHHGTYLEIRRPRHLVFTFASEPDARDADVVVVEIVRAAEGSRVTLTHDLRPEWAAHADRTERGWSGILERLAAAVSMPAPDTPTALP